MALLNPAFKIQVNGTSTIIEGTSVEITQGALSTSSVRNIEVLTSEGVDNERYRVRNATPQQFTIRTHVPFDGSAFRPFMTEESSVILCMGRLCQLTLLYPESFDEEVICLDARVVARGSKTIAAGVPDSYNRTIVCEFIMKAV